MDAFEDPWADPLSTAPKSLWWRERRIRLPITSDILQRTIRHLQWPQRCTLCGVCQIPMIWWIYVGFLGPILGTIPCGLLAHLIQRKRVSNIHASDLQNRSIRKGSSHSACPSHFPLCQVKALRTLFQREPKQLNEPLFASPGCILQM